MRRAYPAPPQGPSRLRSGASVTWCGPGPRLAGIGDVTRFENPRRLCSWAGLTPRLRESDAHTQRGHITKMACGGREPDRPLGRFHLEVIMTILGGLDIHRAQLTYDYLDVGTGEVHTGRITPTDRDSLGVWLRR